LVIGKSGKKIDEIAEEIREKFGFENPLIDVREIENPFLDAAIVAKRVAKALERGINYKKVCNYYVSKVMEAGAIGVQIRVAGKLAGKERSRFQKFKAGFITHTGEYAERLVDRAQAQAMLKPGIVGIEVKIMKHAPKEFEFERKA
jgi:small subunit ribosomal protein S3